MTGQVRIEFDMNTGRVSVYGPMENQAQKDLTVKVLAAAMGIVIDYQPSAITKPNGGIIVPAKTKPDGASPKEIVN